MRYVPIWGREEYEGEIAAAREVLVENDTPADADGPEVAIEPREEKS